MYIYIYIYGIHSTYWFVLRDGSWVGPQGLKSPMNSPIHEIEQGLAMSVRFNVLLIACLLECC